MVPLSMGRASALAAVVTLSAVLACGGGTPAGPSGNGKGGGSKGTTTTGTLTVNLTDSPFGDAKALLVTFSSVEVRVDGGGWQTIPFGSGTSITCDLKKLQGPSDVLGTGPLAAGHYTQIRVFVASASIHFDAGTDGRACAPSIAAPAGSSAPIEVRSGEVKMNREFTIASGATTILLDFDADQSVKLSGDGAGGRNPKYNLNPVITVVSVQ